MCLPVYICQIKLCYCELQNYISSFLFQFYVYENNLELYARDMLLMNIALEPQSSMGLQGE